MEKNAISVSVKHFSLVDRVVIEKINGFSETIFWYLYNRIGYFRTRHSSWKSGSCIAEKNVHEQFQGHLPFLQEIFNSLFVVQFRWIFNHNPRYQKFQQYFWNKTFFQIFPHKSNLVRCDQNMMRKMFDKFLIWFSFPQKLADRVKMHGHFITDS